MDNFSKNEINIKGLNKGIKGYSKTPIFLNNKPQKTVFSELGKIDKNKIYFSYPRGLSEGDFFLFINKKNENQIMNVHISNCPFKRAGYEPTDTIYFKPGFYYKLPSTIMDSPKERLVKSIPFPPKSSIKADTTGGGYIGYSTNWDYYFKGNEPRMARKIGSHCSLDLKDSSINSRVFGKVMPPLPLDTNVIYRDSISRFHDPGFRPYDLYFSFHDTGTGRGEQSNCHVSVSSFHYDVLYEESKKYAIRNDQANEFGSASPPWYAINLRTRYLTLPFSAEIKISCEGKEMIINFSSNGRRHLRFDSIPFIPGKWEIDALKLLKENYGGELASKKFRDYGRPEIDSSCIDSFYADLLSPNCGFHKPKSDFHSIYVEKAEMDDV